MTVVVGYVRASTLEQKLSGLGLQVQVDAIRERYPEAQLVEEVASGGRADNRPELVRVRRELRQGDVLCVLRLDRLTRSLQDFAEIVAEAQRLGWKLVVLEGGFDMTTPTGRAMAGMLAVFAQFEREMIRERTRAAWAAKRAADPALSKREADVVQLRTEGHTQRGIAAVLGLHRSQVRRILGRAATA